MTRLDNACVPHQNDHEKAQDDCQACAQANHALANHNVGHDLLSRRCIAECLDGTKGSLADINGNAASQSKTGVGVVDV